ncbi:MAG TPA: STAS domain-containing protein [Jatrophihabitans sp.]|nr:STAS domain-containing protein [Jatrophihabitans sp.]
MAELGLGDGDAPEIGSTLAVEQLPTEPPRLVLKLSGQVDVSTEGLLRDAIDGAVTAGASNLVLDMSEVDFMDSSGIAVLLVAGRRVDALELRNPTEIIRRVITIAGLSEALRMTPDA